MEEGYARLMIGVFLSMVVMVYWVIPYSYSSGERYALNSAIPCKPGTLAKIDLKNDHTGSLEHWVCANEKWTEQ